VSERNSSPLLLLPGAVAGEGIDEGVAAHYGSFLTEQRDLLEAGAFVDHSHRDVVRVTGPDRLDWLHSLTTQYLVGLAPNVWTDVLILTPQGRIEHSFTGYDDGETLWAHTEPGAGEALIGFLDRMRFMSRVEVAPVDELKTIARWHDGVLSWEFVTDLTAAEGAPAGMLAHEALRIEAHIPRFSLDTDDRTIPNEVGLLNTAVHLDKGCYRGQETVARVHNLGKPPRRLVMLNIDGSTSYLPSNGVEVTFDGKVVGVVGSAARHHELGPIGLALIKRNTPTDAILMVDGVSAAQDVVVDPDAGLHVRTNVGRA
jgi:folate-binding protein YgfZ